MNVYWKALFFVLISAVLVFRPAFADEVVLKNGDRITGKLVRLEGSKLEFETVYAGKITIDWNQVASLLTDEPIKVILSDDTTMEGKILSTEEDTMKLKTEKIEQPTAFRYAEIKAINPPEKPPVKITANVNFGLSNQRGNTETDQLNVLGEIVARTAKSRYTAGGRVNREKSDGEDTSKNWAAYGKYDHFLTDKWFFNISTLLEHDDFADLDLRTTLGAGLGHQFYESETLNLSAVVGPAYVNENFIEAPDDDFSAGQWQINYDQYFFKKFFQLFHNSTGFVGLTDTSNWLVFTRQGVRIPLYKGFTLTLQYNYDYNNDPSPTAKEKWDSKFMTLIGYHIEGGGGSYY